MNKIFVVLIGAMLLLSNCNFKSTHEYIGGTCFTNVSIIDAESGLQEGMTVVIIDGAIVEVAKTAELSLASSNHIIDGTGKFMIPGLWDAHVHFAYIEELAPSMFDLFLSHGITSVRDTGGKIDFVKKWRDTAMADPTAAPRVMIAGPLLDGTPNVYDGSTPSRPELSVGAGSVEEAVAIVDRLSDAGVDLIKAYEMLTPEQFAAITARARSKGLKVTGHVPLSMDVISAAEAGMNSMEHMRNLEMSCAMDAEELLAVRRKLLADGSNEEGGPLRARIHAAQRAGAVSNQDATKTAAVLSALKTNEVWQIPTLSIMTGISNRPFGRQEWIDGFKYLPTDIAERWRQGVSQIMGLEITQAQKDYAQWSFDMIAKVHREEIGIMAGTDCPIFFLTPGRSLHEELALLVRGGLSPLAAIESATLRPAQYFDMQDRLGLIKEGYEADLVLLNANPLTDIANTMKINSVIRAGRVYDRGVLDVVLADLESH